jgi:tetraacyldisaccharide 4'-kinase
MGRVLNAMSLLYGTAAAWRRGWYDRHPRHRRRLDSPVVSVGNLSVGGSGKTPVVRALAQLLLKHGERPAVLSRGYGRAHQPAGVTVVSSGDEVLVSVESAGDEPLMLARALPGVPVLVCADRYRAGQLAEQRFGATVHLLDDGFQHLQLSRDIDLLVTGEQDLIDRPLPGGRLREPLRTASRAHAALVAADTFETAVRVGERLGVGTVFRLSRRIGQPEAVKSGLVGGVSPDQAVLAVAGIARPERFFSDLRKAGWGVAGTLAFPDHHPFTANDLVKIGNAARAVQASFIFVTEKDATRLQVGAISDVPVAAVPLIVAIEPPDQFGEWLRESLARARSRRRSADFDASVSGAIGEAVIPAGSGPAVRSEPSDQ